VNQEVADAAAYASDRCRVCTHQMAALFCVKWRHGCHLERMTSNCPKIFKLLRIWVRHIKCPTRTTIISICCRISSRSNVKQRSLSLVLKRSPQQRKRTRRRPTPDE